MDSNERLRNLTTIAKVNTTIKNPLLDFVLGASQTYLWILRDPIAAIAFLFGPNFQIRNIKNSHAINVEKIPTLP